MKKLSILILSLILCLSLFSCASANGDKEHAGDFIYTADTDLQIVYNGDFTSHDGVGRIYNDLRKLLMISPWVVTDAKSAADHEIVIGETNRQISKEAYRRLDLLEKEYNTGNYCENPQKYLKNC